VSPERAKIAVIGAGNLSHAPAVFATLAHWNAEKPLDIWLWDGDAEMLEVFYMLAQTCLFATRSTHRLYPTLDPTEALEHAEKIVVALGERGCVRFAGAGADPVGAAYRRLQLLFPDDARVGCVIEPTLDGADSVPLIPGGETVSDALRMLRYINGEDSIWDLLNPNATNRLRDWLNGH